ELRCEPLRERLLVAVRDRGPFFAAQAPALGAEVVECDRAGELAEPRPRRAAPLVKAVPEAEGALEGLRREVLGDEAVAGEPGDVAVDVVEVPLGRLREAHAWHTPPVDDLSHICSGV